MAITTTAVQNFGKEFSFNVCPANIWSQKMSHRVTTENVL